MYGGFSSFILQLIFQDNQEENQGNQLLNFFNILFNQVLLLLFYHFYRWKFNFILIH